jgi:hypothetical protein
MPILTIDWKNPDYADVFKERTRRLAWLRENATRLHKVRKYYATAPGGIAAFITDWAMTMDPRVSGKGRTPLMPFILFPKQVELVNFIIDQWRADEPGVLVKSRDVGASWIAFAAACALCIFNKDMAIGFGSAKEDKLDRSGDPDTLFAKGRMFMQYIPQEFRAGYTEKNNATHLRIGFPDTGSSITGEAGDNMGRGGRKAIYFIDEAAFVERPLKIDGNLAANTNCRIDMSTVNGTANPFAQKALNGKVKRMDITWRDDPRKDEVWYAKKVIEIDNPVIVAQELDCSWSASAEGVIIPSVHVQALVDAHVKLGIKPSGMKRGGLDVADMGRDKNAFIARHGCLVPFAAQWSGSAEKVMSDSAEKAFTLCDDWGLNSFLYDGDGLGAGTRSDVKRLAANRTLQQMRPVVAKMYRGSGAVHNPEGKVRGTDRTNEDYYKNAKAQNWFHVARMCKVTYNAVVHGLPFDPVDIISIASTCPERTRLMAELSQPIYKQDNSGKMLVDKLPDGALSPNIADALVIAFSLGGGGMQISEAALEATGGPRGGG